MGYHMKKKSVSRIHKILNILQIVFILISSICIIVACLHIYFTGGNTPYSRDIVTKHFNYISIPIYITFAFIIIGIIFNMIFPCEKKDKEFYGKPVRKGQYDTNKRVVLIVRSSVLLIAVIFITYGFISGGAIAVLTKAVNICTECIGLG